MAFHAILRKNKSSDKTLHKSPPHLVSSFTPSPWSLHCRNFGILTTHSQQHLPWQHYPRLYQHPPPSLSLFLLFPLTICHHLTKLSSFLQLPSHFNKRSIRAGIWFVFLMIAFQLPRTLSLEYTRCSINIGWVNESQMIKQINNPIMSVVLALYHRWWNLGSERF